MQPQNCQHHFSNFVQLQKYITIGFLFTICFLSLLVTCVQSDDYLKEKPSFLTPCSISDPKNGPCIAKAVENIFTNWKDGVPGLKSIGSIDPWKVKKIHMEQSNQNINLKIDLKDLVMEGLSKTKVTKASVNKEFNFKLFVKLPSLRSKSKYHMKGSILFLNLDGNGFVESEMSDVDLIFSFKANLITVNNRKFFDIISLRSSIKNIGKFYINYGNLFNNNAELTESANAVFNQNWRELFEIVRPSLEETLDTIALNRYKKIFLYVPANYFFVDLP